MNPNDRKTWAFAISWAARWYQASMAWDETWLVLVVWIGLWWLSKKRKRKAKSNERDTENRHKKPQVVEDISKMELPQPDRPPHQRHSFLGRRPCPAFARATAASE